MSKRGITKGEPRAKVDRKHRSPKKNESPQKFARELRATGVEWGSLVAYCELADLDEWVVLNESVMMADASLSRSCERRLRTGAARSASSKNRETYVCEIISILVLH